MNYCSKCGHPLSGNQRFCTHCGAPLNTLTPQAPPSPMVSPTPVPPPPLTRSAAPQAPVPPMTPPVTGQNRVASTAPCLMTMEAGGRKGLSSNYVYLLFYMDRILAVTIPQKQMEQDIYGALKDLKSQRKVSMKERLGFRKTYINEFINHLKTLPDQTMVSTYGNTLILPTYGITKVVCQFQSQTTNWSDEDGTSTTTRGYITFHYGGNKYKYAHGYGYHKNTHQTLSTLFGNRLKVHR